MTYFIMCWHRGGLATTVRKRQTPAQSRQKEQSQVLTKIEPLGWRLREACLMNNRWFAEAAEGIRYFLEMLQDILLFIQKRAAR